METTTAPSSALHFNPVLCTVASLCFGTFVGWALHGGVEPIHSRPRLAPMAKAPSAIPARLPITPVPRPPPPPTLSAIPAQCTHALADEERACPGAVNAIVQEGPNQYRIHRRLMGCMLGAPAALFRPPSRIVPAFADGKPGGIKILSLPPGSVYQRLGLRNGDRILRVNGQAVTTADSMLRIYESVRAPTRFTVELERYQPPGKLGRVTLTYRLIAG